MCVIVSGNALLLVVTVLLFDYCNKPCGHVPHNTTTTSTTTTTSSPLNTTAQQPLTSTILYNTSYLVNNSGQIVVDTGPESHAVQNNCCPRTHLSHDNWLQIILTVEAAILIPILVIYFGEMAIFFKKNFKLMGGKKVK